MMAYRSSCPFGEVAAWNVMNELYANYQVWCAENEVPAKMSKFEQWAVTPPPPPPKKKDKGQMSLELA